MLTLKNITKTYPGVVALDDVSLEFSDGRVHALLGENGAGKSTLIKVIAGAIIPDTGQIEIDGSAYSRLTPQLATEKGISVIYQELNLAGPLSVAENIYLGRPQSRLFSHKQLCIKARQIFDQNGFDLDPAASVMSLPPASQQLVEISKAISNKAKYIIMDEPTASLASHEVDLLFDIIRRLKAQGVTIIYISHRMDEVFEITDDISILRDGSFVASLETKNTSRQELVNLMVGRELNESYPERHHKIGEVVLEAEDLTGNSVEHISFRLHKGEILGFAGLVGSGRTETAELICGAAKIDSGSLKAGGKTLRIKSPSDAIRAGIGLIPENRKEQGCILFNSVLFNTTLICNSKYMKAGVLSRRRQKQIAEEYRKALGIKVPNVSQLAVNLSGGNQQKVVVSKTLAADLDIIVFDEPTKGIDVGAKQEIYNLMNRLAAEGKAIIMISSEMEEILGMSDRILVLHEGRISGELKKEQFSQENVLSLASGMEVSS